MGFGLPIESWFRDDLKNWAGDLLSPKKLEKHGFLNSDVVKKLWNEHLTGKKIGIISYGILSFYNNGLKLIQRVELKKILVLGGEPTSLLNFGDTLLKNFSTKVLK